MTEEVMGRQTVQGIEKEISTAQATLTLTVDAHRKIKEKNNLDDKQKAQWDSSRCDS